MNAVGAYIFAGGFTVGVSKHYDVIAHLEGDAYGNKTFKMNFPDIPSHWPPSEWPLEALKGKVEFLYANPPCAPWSQVGASLSSKNAQNWRTDPRTDCFRRSVGAGLEVEAGAIAVESVLNAMTRGWDFAADQARRMHEKGYEVSIVRHDSVFWGLPQRRRRLFLVGTKFHVDWPPPPCVFVTARSVIEPLEDLGLVKTLEGKYLPLWELLALEPPDKKRSLRTVYLETYKTNKGSPRLTTHMVSLDGPISTIIGLTQIHPEQPRYFSERELARLNGFPDWFKFHHADRKHVLPAIASEIARGVNPVIAEWLAGVLKGASAAKAPPSDRIRIVDFTVKSRKELVPANTVTDVTERVYAS